MLWLLHRSPNHRKKQKKHGIDTAIPTIIMYYYDEFFGCDSELSKLIWHWRKVFVCLIKRRICGFQTQSICSNPKVSFSIIDNKNKLTINCEHHYSYLSVIRQMPLHMRERHVAFQLKMWGHFLPLLVVISHVLTRYLGKYNMRADIIR